MIVKILDNKRQMQIVDCSNEELEQAQIYFTRKIRNYWFNPLVKKKLWDGNIKFLDNSLKLSVGLWGELKNFCDINSLKLKILNKEYLLNSELNKKDFLKWIDENFDKNKLYPNPHQISSAYKILKFKRSISEIATSGGKTLIMFMVFLYLKNKKFFNEKEIKGFVLNEQMLIIVPSIDLVIQTYNKFDEYNNLIKSPIKFNIQMFGGGAPKIKKNSDLVIGTFQTLKNLTKDYFETVKVVCVDEAHYTLSKSIQDVLKKCENAEYRFGLSGTMKASDGSADAFTIQALLGPMINKVTAKFLFENNYATPVDVIMVYLDYLDNDIRKKLKFLKKYKKNDDKNAAEIFNLEKKIVIFNEKRKNYIIELLSKTKRNTLVLFHNIKNNYGKNIYEELKNYIDEKTNLFYIDGSVSKDLREQYRNLASSNEEGNYIIIASFGTMSTGIDISNIQDIYLLESFKSEVIIKQTIGRGMRLNKIKKRIRVFDFVDDFRINGFENYIYKHSIDRINIYKNEGYKIYRKNIKL